MQGLVDFFRREPEKVFFVLRAILLTLVALGVGLSNDTVEVALALLAAVLGLDFAATQKTHDTTYGSQEALTLVNETAAAGAVPRGLWTFVLEQVKRLIPAAEVPFAMAKIAGELLQFANRALDADTKADVLKFVHTKLRQLGYLKGRDFPPAGGSTTIVMSLLLVVALSGCIPIVNQFTGDGAELTYAEAGILFLPNGVTYEVLVDIQGSEVSYLGESDLCQPTNAGLKCEAAEVADPWLIEIVGFNVTAVATYQRQPGGRSFYLLPQ